MKRHSCTRCNTNLLPTGADDVRHPNLVQRGGIYYIRRRVPADLLPIWEGGPVIVKSLNTRDRRTAVELFHAAQGELQKKFDDIRKDHAQRSARASQVEQDGVYELSDSETEALVNEWRDERLATLSVAADSVLSEEDARELSAELDRDVALLTSPVTEVLAQEIGTITRRLLVRSGMPIAKCLGAIELQAKDAGVPLYAVGVETTQKLFSAVREVEVQLAQARRDRIRGQTSSVSLPKTQAAPRVAYRLEDLLQDFSNNPGRGSRTAKTDLDYGMVFRAMRDVIGAEKLVSEITREDCTKVRDLFISLPRDATKRYPTKRLTEVSRKDGEAGLKTSTINSHLSKMSSVFAWAVIEGHRSSSPAKSLQIAESLEEQEEDGRRSFTIEELRAMFSAPLYTGCRDDGRNFWKAGPNHPRRPRFWVPLIALFSGLRQTEICQLTPLDIDVLSGIDVIHVRKTQVWQKLKTASAKRYVPLHPELIKIGLVKYAAMIRAQGEQQLFPDVKPDSRGYMGAVFQKRFNSFRVSVGITDPNAVFHSFRHTWRDAVRNAGIQTEMAQVLGGWAGVGQDQRYGSERFSPGVRLRDISRINYEGLDLSHLYIS